MHGGDTRPLLDYRELFRASPHGCLVVAADFSIRDANAAYADLVDMSRESLVGKPFFPVLAARLQDIESELRASFGRVLDRGQADTLALPRGRPPTMDGHDAWHIQNTPLLDKAGNTEAILHCITTDPRPPNAGAPRLSSSQDLAGDGDDNDPFGDVRRFRQLMEQAPGFLAVGYGPEHRFELVNNAYYQLVGHRDIVGKPVRDALPELQGQGFFELLDKVYATGEPYIGRAMPIQVQLEPGAPLVERYIDFVYQPLTDEGGSVSGIFVQGHDVTEAHELSRMVSHQASHDVLTGLMNRREFERRLHQAVTERPGDGPHSLVYLDLDQFKVVNDTCGHAAGDELLRQIGALLADEVPSRHALARLGGDEFGILFEQTAAAEALALAERLRVAIGDTEYVSGRRRFGCAASLGLISFGEEIGSAAQALSAADTACLLAKEKGRNRVQVHEPDDDEIAERRREMDWVSRLRDAISEQRLVLYAQRIQSLAPVPDATTRLELLVRLRDTDGTIVPPMAFIPAAERYGDMPTLDRFVIHEARDFLQSLPADRRALTQLSVNLSGATINDGRLLSFIQHQFQDCRDCATQICFELTETAALQNLALTAKLMIELKALGFRFALDDFGSGMSSLSYLKHLPVDYVKIDGIFIRDVVADPIDAAIVEAIARVAQAIGIETVAEYVSTPEACQLLARLGIDYAQGYGVHVPEPLADALVDGNSSGG